jgi:hypothetical protein
VSAALANLFPPIEDAERVAGSTKYRKFFWKAHEDGSNTLFSAQVYMERMTAGQDVFSIFAADQTDTQAGITGFERRFAVGDLNANVDAGATEIEVETEDDNATTLFAGDTVRITDKTSREDLGGNTEFGVIDAVPSVVGNVVTITLVNPLDNGYLASNTRVMAVYEPGNLVAAVSDFLVTSDDGVYDDAQIALNNRGTEEQTITITFTNATNYGVVSDIYGSLGTGTVGGGAAPNNPSWTKPYFTLAAGGFSGTWEAGDTIVFSTHPAAIPMWAKRVVPANASVAGSNTASARLRGQVT